MNSWRAFTLAIHLSSLGLWAGSAIMSTAVAAISFPLMKSMEVRIPGLALDQNHYRFVAGALAQRTFLIADIISFACAMAAGATMLVMIALHKNVARRLATIFRGVGLGVAIASLGAMLFVITPQMNAATRLHLEAARIGNSEAAKGHALAVDELHPVAAVLLLIQIVAVLVTLFAGAWSAASQAGPSSPTSGSPYPEPELRRKKR
ncbi:MAG: hypothetical protein K2W85_15335 [Phycisphaerales bacterium]|nr:hypothetical protein [Phycisphaerales bacterium]